MKSLKCKDLGVKCNFEARAISDEEVIRILKEHARKFHLDKIKSIPDEKLTQTMRGKIREIAKK